MVSITLIVDTKIRIYHYVIIMYVDILRHFSVSCVSLQYFKVLCGTLWNHPILREQYWSYLYGYHNLTNCHDLLFKSISYHVIKICYGIFRYVAVFYGTLWYGSVPRDQRPSYFYEYHNLTNYHKTYCLKLIYYYIIIT